MLRPKNIAIVAIVVFAVFCRASVATARQDVLAIFNLTPTNMEAMGYDGEILYALISELERQKTIELMPRREMEEILFQTGLVQGGGTGSIVKAGKALGINFILFGSVTKKPGQILAKLKLMDVQNKRVVKTWDKSFAGREAILKDISAFAGELTDTINRKASSAASAAAPGRFKVDIKNLRAKSQGRKVVLTWKFDPSKPIAGFNVYRSEHAGGPYQFHGRTRQNSFEDTKIKKGKSYYYRLGITLDSGEEVKSRLTTQIKSVGEKIPHPPLVLGGKGYVRRTEIKFVPSLVNEQEKFKIKTYKVYRKKSSDNNWKNITSLKAKTSSQYELAFNVEDKNNLEDGETYFYAVSSLDKRKRESPLSDPVTIQTIPPPNLTVEKDNLLRKISVAWQPREGVEGYYLYRKGGQGDWEKIAKIRASSKPEYVDDDRNLEDGRVYLYHLTVYDAKGESGPSKIVRAKTKDLPPYPRDVITQSGLVKSVRIFWRPVEDADIGGYAIYRGTSPRDLERIAEVKGYRSDTYLDKGTGFEPLKDGLNFFYAVVSYNLFGADGKSTQIVKATTKPRPTPVKGLTASIGADYIQLKWRKNSEYDIETYILSRSRNGGFWSTLEKLGADRTDFQDTDLKPETDYRYRLIAQDKDGLESNPVESKSIASPVAKPKK